jgi:hypothetical protein
LNLQAGDKVYLRRPLTNVMAQEFRQNTRMTVTQMYADSFGCYVNLCGGDDRILCGVQAADISVDPCPPSEPDPYADL